MMKIIFTILLMIFAITTAHADIDALLAKDFPGWDIDHQVTGNLDGDNTPDAAAVIWQQPKDEESRGNALLVVYLNGKLHTKAENATCIGCGGPKASFDQPLGTLKITDKGLLTVSYSGGARSMYDIVMKWRLDKPADKFLLIGESTTTTDTLGEYPEEFMDINYSTLNASRRTGKKTVTCPVSPQQKLQELSGFDYYEKHGNDIEAINAACPK